MNPTKRSPFPPDFSYEPWLIQTFRAKNAPLNFINPFDASIDQIKIPELQGKLCLGYYGEWLLLLDVSCKDFFFLNLSLDSKIHLPHMSESFETLGGCVITSCPTSPKCVILFVLKDQNFVLHCRPHDHNWNKVQCKLHMDKVFSGDIVMYKGKLYALGMNSFTSIGLVFTDLESLVNGTASWTRISCKYITHGFQSRVPHLVVFKENVFLVVVYFHLRVVKEVNILCLQNCEPSLPYWSDQRGIDRLIFFLGWNNNTAVITSDKILQMDCVYVLRAYDEGELLYKILLDKHISSFNIVLKLTVKDKNKFCWIVPSKTRRSKWLNSKSSRIITSIECKYNLSIQLCLYSNIQTSVKDGSSDEENTNDVSSQWSDMPLELLELVVKKLSLVDCIYVPTICKSWSSVPNHIHEAKVWPWLMYFPKDDGVCRFIDPFYGKEYYIDLKPLLDFETLTLHSSKQGLVLVSTENRSLFVINPFNRNVVKLSVSSEGFFNDLSFNSSPTSSDFIVYGFKRYDIATWTPQEKDWKVSGGEGSYYINGRNNLVLFNGEIYCLGKTGRLVVFNLESQEVRVLNEPTPIHSEERLERTEDRYLIEFEGELVSVKGTKGTEDPIRVYKLDQRDMSWNQMDDLGDLTLFLNPKNPMAKRSPFKNCSNRIYLPRFDDTSKHGVYYSMETHRYYPKAYNMTEPCNNYLWIEPNFNSS